MIKSRAGICSENVPPVMTPNPIAEEHTRWIRIFSAASVSLQETLYLIIGIRWMVTMMGKVAVQDATAWGDDLVSANYKIEVIKSRAGICSENVPPVMTPNPIAEEHTRWIRIFSAASVSLQETLYLIIGIRWMVTMMGKVAVQDATAWGDDLVSANSSESTRFLEESDVTFYF